MTVPVQPLGRAWSLALLAAAAQTAACQQAAPPATAAAASPLAAAPPTCPAADPPPGPRGERFRWLASSFRMSLAKFDADPDPTTRDVMNAALASLILDGNGKAAEALISRVFAAQAADGKFPWNERTPNYKDENALEFSMQSLGPILLRYQGCLRPAFVESLLPRVRASIALLERDNARLHPAYTNIWLLHAANLVLLGGAVSDADAEARGIAELEQWRALAKRDGIFEFDSPTYYAVDLDALVMAERFARAPRAREVARAALDLFWTDVAANWFAPRESLVGPHSRDYDFLLSAGQLDAFTAVAGWRKLPQPEAIDLFQVSLLAAEAQGGYQPPEPLTAMATSGAPRVVTSRWYGDTPAEGRERYAFVTPRFAMGSTSATYPGTAQFKPLEIQLDSPRGTPTIAVVTRDAVSPGDDEPYGVSKRKDGAGHPKPVHLPMHPVAVQERGQMLASLVADAPADPPAEISTSVLFPVGVPGERIMLDDTPIEGDQPRAWPAAVGSVLTVRVGGSAAAVRVASAEGCGQAPALRVQLDETGLSRHAGRLVVRQYRREDATGPWRAGECHPRLTLVLVAGDAANDADARALAERARAKVDERVDRGDHSVTWTGRVDLGGVVLGAHRRDDFDGRKHFVHDVVRTVNDAPMRFGVLEVNGKDVSGPGG